jgi:hypothetical protein
MNVSENDGYVSWRFQARSLKVLSWAISPAIKRKERRSHHEFALFRNRSGDFRYGLR